MKYFGKILPSIIPLKSQLCSEETLLMLSCPTSLIHFSIQHLVCQFYRIRFAETLVYHPLDPAESVVPRHWLPSPLFLLKSTSVDLTWLGLVQQQDYSSGKCTDSKTSHREFTCLGGIAGPCASPCLLTKTNSIWPLQTFSPSVSLRAGAKLLFLWPSPHSGLFHVFEEW